MSRSPTRGGPELCGGVCALNLCAPASSPSSHTRRSAAYLHISMKYLHISMKYLRNIYEIFTIISTFPGEHGANATLHAHSAAEVHLRHVQVRVVLYCTVCTILYCSVPYCTVLHRFVLSPRDPAIPPAEKAATDSERKVTFLSLVPGRLYNITMWTVSQGVTSRPVERQDRSVRSYFRCYYYVVTLSTMSGSTPSRCRASRPWRSPTRPSR